MKQSKRNVGAVIMSEIWRGLTGTAATIAAEVGVTAKQASQALTRLFRSNECVRREKRGRSYFYWVDVTGTY